MAGNRTYELQRLQELIVYVAKKSVGDINFGATKLNKLLFFCDFGAYRTLGQAITGAEYWNLPEGPVPHQALVAIEKLGRDVHWESVPVGPFERKRLVADRVASVGLFTGPEVALVDNVINELWPMTARQVSDLSHETMAWRLSVTKQQIPYGTALFSSDEPTDKDLAWLEDIAANEPLAK